MNAKICDGCKKVIPENNIKYLGLFLQRFELCEECNKKAQAIKSEYEVKEKTLEQSHELLVKTIKDKIKEVGIEVQ